jgi:hypothetical protein
MTPMTPCNHETPLGLVGGEQPVKKDLISCHHGNYLLHNYLLLCCNRRTSIPVFLKFFVSGENVDASENNIGS